MEVSRIREAEGVMRPINWLVSLLICSVLILTGCSGEFLIRPPDIEIETLKGEKIPYKTKGIKWGINSETSKDSIKEFLAEKQLKDFIQLRSGEDIQIGLPQTPKMEIQLLEFDLLQDLQGGYSIVPSQEATFTRKDNENGRIEIRSKEPKVKVLRLMAFWGEQVGEYTFIVRIEQ